MVTFIIVVGVILVLLFLTVVVYPALAKKLSPSLKRLNIRPLGQRGPRWDAEWDAQQLNKVAEATESESPLSSEHTVKQSSISPTSQDERIKQLEDKIEILNKRLLGTATVAASTAAKVLEPERLKFFQGIRDQAYKDVSSSQPDSDIIEITSALVSDGIGVSDYARAKIIDKKPSSFTTPPKAPFEENHKIDSFEAWKKPVIEVEPGNFTSQSEIPPDDSQQ